MKTQIQLTQSIRRQLLLFMIFLVLSGLTAFPLELELSLLVKATKNAPLFIQIWLNDVYHALQETNAKYPFMAYGTDWLAFAHIVIATAFIGPLKDPVKNIWVIQFGMIACLMVFPLAFICGPIRQIPIYWRLIDCSFGLLGFIPLYLAYKKTIALENLTNTKK